MVGKQRIAAAEAPMRPSGRFPSSARLSDYAKSSYGGKRVG